jgi:hypothetical protein
MTQPAASCQLHPWRTVARARACSAAAKRLPADRSLCRSCCFQRCASAAQHCRPAEPVACALVTWRSAALLVTASVCAQVCNAIGEAPFCSNRPAGGSDQPTSGRHGWERYLNRPDIVLNITQLLGLCSQRMTFHPVVPIMMNNMYTGTSSR